VTGSKALCLTPQLAGRDGPSKENGCNYGCKKCGFDYFFAHGFLAYGSLLIQMTTLGRRFAPVTLP
jgi:hypothetical protein